MNCTLLNAIVDQAPPKLEAIFQQEKLPDTDRGACVTYSRILSEVLGEFGIQAEVWPVLIITVNRVGKRYMEDNLGKREAARQGGAVQYWGNIEKGQRYQHAVTYIKEWAVIVDLSISRRASCLVPSHPFWGVLGNFPWWVYKLEFKHYALSDSGYMEFPDKVKTASAAIRKIVRRNREGGEP